ncbi:MAG: trypsin-like peptidase domain-containing protein [Proteobacteria bacterium]|nr:trypsin-like peptidase domain-containing protein [Pseudomonadota bacterium]
MNRGSSLLSLIVMVAALGVGLGLMGGYDQVREWFESRPSVADLHFVQHRATDARPASLTSDEQHTIKLIARAQPAVVNITTVTLAYNYFMEIVPRRGQGTGFIIDPRGYILTNNHVVAGARRIQVRLADGRRLWARLVGRDTRTDLAVIRVRTSRRLAVLPLGDSKHLRVGQKVVAIGNPFGLGHTVTTGIISALNRNLRTRRGMIMRGLIQTDAAINPGNSGGPLLDSAGRVIGINTVIFSPSGASHGIGFAIPVSRAREVAKALIAQGRVVRPWLGLEGMTLRPEYANVLELLVNQGVLLVRVFKGGPAAAAGLKGSDSVIEAGNLRLPAGGDVIVAVDGRPIQSMNQLMRLISRMKVGRVVTLDLYRAGRKIKVKVKLTARPG